MWCSDGGNKAAVSDAVVLENPVPLRDVTWTVVGWEMEPGKGTLSFCEIRQAAEFSVLSVTDSSCGVGL